MKWFYIKLEKLLLRISRKVLVNDKMELLSYKAVNGHDLNMAEQVMILKECEKVKKGDMKLSEYIRKYGTCYVDEQFLPLYKDIKNEPIGVMARAKLIASESENKRLLKEIAEESTKLDVALTNLEHYKKLYNEVLDKSLSQEITIEDLQLQIKILTEKLDNIDTNALYATTNKKQFEDKAAVQLIEDLYY